MAIPAYFRPTSTDGTDGIPYWTKLRSSDGRVRFAVMNPYDDAAGESNPDTGDPQQNLNYVNTVNETTAAGVRVFGYVDTKYGAISEADVIAYINKYYEMYDVDGVFLDQVEFRDCSKDAYYQNIYNRTKDKGGLVILNPGAQTEECYAKSADIIVNFENTYEKYAEKDNTGAYEYDKGEPAWVHNYPPSMFWHLVYSARDVAAMRDAVRLGKQRWANHMYVTPDTMPNQWDTLPSDPYWSEELTALFSPEIRVQPYRLRFFLRQSIQSVTKSVELTSTFNGPVTVTVEDATVDIAHTDFGGGSGEFSNFSGQRIITPNGRLSFWVKFTGKSGLRPASVPGSLRVRWDSGQETIQLLGSLSGPEIVS